MKQELKMFATLNLLAFAAWGVLGGVYGTYQAMAEMGNMVWAVAFWLLLVMLLTLVGGIECYTFRSLVRLLKALNRWIEMRNFVG